MRFTHPLAAAAALALLATLSGRVAAAEPDLTKYGFSDPKGLPPATVYWHCNVSSGSTPPIQRNAGRWRLAYLRVDEEKHPFVGTLESGYGRYFAATDGGKPYASVCMSYRIEVGNVLPMFDGMYKVAELSPGTNVLLKRVTDSGLVKNLTSDRDLIVVPVGSNAGFLYQHEGTPGPVSAVVGIDSVAAGEGGAGAADCEGIRLPEPKR